MPSQDTPTPTEETTEIPYGYCHCGCGEKTSIATQTKRQHGHVKGEPYKYRFGHSGKLLRDRTPINPSGLCKCGCGDPAPLAERSRASQGHIKGQPILFIPGHQTRSTRPDYVVEDRGFKTPCWLWQKALNHKGYAQKSINGGKRMAHIVYYEQVHGPIPAGMELDHLCRVRHCCNPAHLEPVTHLENVRRGNSPSAIACRTNKCKRGHEFTPENTRIRANGSRACVKCRLMKDRERNQRVKDKRLIDLGGSIESREVA